MSDEHLSPATPLLPRGARRPPNADNVALYGGAQLPPPPPRARMAPADNPPPPRENVENPPNSGNEEQPPPARHSRCAPSWPCCLWSTFGAALAGGAAFGIWAINVSYPDCMSDCADGCNEAVNDYTPGRTASAALPLVDSDTNTSQRSSTANLLGEACCLAMNEDAGRRHREQNEPRQVRPPHSEAFVWRDSAVTTWQRQQELHLGREFLRTAPTNSHSFGTWPN